MKQDPGATGAAPAHEMNSAGNIFAQMTKLPGAITRFLAGPPMSERTRFRQNVAEARARSDWLGPR